LKRLSGKDLAKLLEKNGWELKRMRGSHHIYKKEDNPSRISIPIHGNQPLKTGLLRHLLKVASIDEDSL